jgi:hypothetical protein
MAGMRGGVKAAGACKLAGAHSPSGVCETDGYLPSGGCKEQTGNRGGLSARSGASLGAVIGEQAMSIKLSVDRLMSAGEGEISNAAGRCRMCGAVFNALGGSWTYY